MVPQTPTGHFDRLIFIVCDDRSNYDAVPIKERGRVKSVSRKPHGANTKSLSAYEQSLSCCDYVSSKWEQENQGGT